MKDSHTDRELSCDDASMPPVDPVQGQGEADDAEPPRGSIAERGNRKKIKRSVYEKELKRLQIELVKLQDWIVHSGEKVVVLFEGRDAAGKGGAIKRITARLNPRICRVVALPKPTDRELTQWYFQRYINHLPAAGEMVLFDRSWYNRAGVERVMGFCTDEQYNEFMRTVPIFEDMIMGSGIRLIKYWFSVSDAEQERRFQDRINDPLKRWKLSPMDLQSRARWEDYTRAKDEMFRQTDTDRSPWWVVLADNKRRARLNCLRHLLDHIPYRDLPPETIDLPPRQEHSDYQRRPLSASRVVKEVY